jgi:hypothetical protein
VILKAMAKELSERYSTMEELESDLHALDDADLKTTGARITAARWRRRQERKGVISFAGWALGALALAGLGWFVFKASTEQEKQKPPRRTARRAVAPRAEAAKPKAAESTDARPAFAIARIELESSPSGASIHQGSRLICEATPCVFETPKVGKQIVLTAELKDHEVATMTVTPELDDGKVVRATLDKRQREPRRMPAPNAPAEPVEKESGLGETLGNPFSKR